MEDLINKHLQVLCGQIGSRPTGSAKNAEAVEYVYNKFSELGFDVRKQEFPCMDWQNDGAELTVDNEKIDAVPGEYSLPCDTECNSVCLNSTESLKEADLSGKIAVLYGDLAKEVLMPKNFTFWNPDEHKLIVGLLEAKNPEAIITVSSDQNVPISIIEDGDFEVPCAAVAGKFLDRFLNSSTSRAHLIIKSNRKPSEASNIIAMGGSGKQKIVFSAHIDTKPNTVGALDNASGVSVLLALASALAREGYKQYAVEFVLFNGEDYYSTPGEVAYMSEYLSGRGDYALAINVDGVGMKNSPTSFSFYECPAELETKVERVAQSLAGFEKIEAWPMGDHMIFAYSGIPTIAITAKNIFEIVNTITHTPNDNLKMLDASILSQVVSFLQECVKQDLEK